MKFHFRLIVSSVTIGRFFFWPQLTKASALQVVTLFTLKLDEGLIVSADYQIYNSLLNCAPIVFAWTLEMCRLTIFFKMKIQHELSLGTIILSKSWSGVFFPTHMGSSSNSSTSIQFSSKLFFSTGLSSLVGIKAQT